jgi:hypothetical protein
LIFRWLEGSFTVAASPFDHTGGCRTGSYAISRRGDLETAIEWVPRPRRWLVFFDYKTGGIAVVLNRRQQSCTPNTCSTNTEKRCGASTGPSTGKRACVTLRQWNGLPSRQAAVCVTWVPISAPCPRESTARGAWSA